MKRLAFTCVAFFFALATWANTSLRVVTTIAPIQSLVGAVTTGVTTPIALVPADVSEHTYALRPSQALALQQADIVFWINDDIETFFPSIIPSLSPKQHVVKLIDAPGLILLDKRNSENWPAHDHDDHTDHARHETTSNPIDGHVWLNPINASYLVAYIAAQLSAIDPANASQYQTNAQALQQQLHTIDGQLQEQLNPIKNKPYWVFHDAYHYFENRYQLNAQGAIALHPEQPLSAKRVQQLQQQIMDSKAVCVFSEPPFFPAIIHTITEKTGVKTAILDPIGSAGALANASGYFTLLHQLSDALVTCLQT